MNKAKSVFNVLQNAIANLISFILAVIMIIILAQTFTRYVVFYSLPWSEEASRYLFIALILLGINVGISQDLMVRIDMIDKILSKKMKKIFEIARNIAALAVSSVFFYSTFGMIRIGSFQKSPAMGLSMDIMYIILCAGFGLACISVIFKLIESIDKLKQKEGGIQ